MKDPPAAAPRLAAEAPSTSLGGVLLFAFVLFCLYVGQGVFVPLALAMLLSVALAPAVDGLQRIGLPRALAVILVMLVTLVLVCGFVLLLVSQAISLAEQLPQHEATLRERLRVLSEGSGVFDRAWETLRRLGEELSARPYGPLPPADGVAQGSVVAVPQASPLATLLGLAGAVVGPLATVAIALLLMAYLLLARADVRDRFLRLVGTHDLHRTTLALADATRRVGRYLLMTLAVNACFGTGMAVGLTLIGVPSAPLWGLLCFVLRFVPFLGAPLSMLFPFLMAFATGNGWTEPLLVLLLFLVVDGSCTYVLEPLLYGGTTGISPLALLVSSALWTVIWGPVGLVLAPAITACLVIIGRHVPGLAFLEIMLGDVEPLPADVRFYQRLLADDLRGAEEVADATHAEDGMAGVVQGLVFPTLESLLQDRRAGILSDAASVPIAAALEQMVGEFDEAGALGDATIGSFGVAGPLDRAMAVGVAACLRDAGLATVCLGRDAAVPGTLRTVVLCMVEPPSPLRQRRALAQVTAPGRRVVVLVLGDPAAQRGGPLGGFDLYRSAETLAAALGRPAPRATPAVQAA